jgi:hypothetical protein
MRLRLAGVKPNSDAMRIMISACRLAIARRLYRKTGRRFHHGPVVLYLLHGFGPHRIGPAICSESSPVEIGYQV